MTPRTRSRVLIVSPNSGSIAPSRSISVQRSVLARSNHSGSRSQRSTSILKTNGRYGGREAYGEEESEMARSHHKEAAARAALNLLREDSNRSGSRFKNTSRSSSASGFRRNAPGVHAPLSSGSHSEFSRDGGGREEDQEAVDRARAILRGAASNILRRPFGWRTEDGVRNVRRSSRSTSRSEGDRVPVTASSGVAASPRARSNSVHSGSGRPPKRRALELPATIPQTRSDDDEEDDELDPTLSSLQHLYRSRDVVDARRQLPRHAAISRFHGANRPDGTVAGEPAATCPVPADPCPPMFSGLSAIPLSANLFECDPFAVPAQRGASSATSRACVRPLWVLVGTFKTALRGVVEIDYPHDSLKWLQANPRGGLQTMKVSLSAMIDVFTAQVAQEDEDIREVHHTLILRTSTRPSQVAFGFHKMSEANRLRSLLKVAMSSSR